METTRKAQKGQLTKYDKSPQVDKSLPKSAKDLMNRKIMSELSSMMENMLILEYGQKITEDGLKTKDRSFLVDQIYVIY